MKKSMSVLKRLLAVLMVFALVIGYVPMGVAAEEVPATPSQLTASITDNMVFAINETTPFTFTTTANSDEGKMVLGSVSFADENGGLVDIQSVAKLEYLDVSDSTWKEFYGDFGPPETGFPMSNATSNFRITFTTEGKYSVTVSMKMKDGTGVLCSKEVKVEAKLVDSSVTSAIPAQHTVNQSAEFTVTTDANSNSGKAVLGSFKVMEGENEITDITSIAKLEYLEPKNGNWYPLTGDFGDPANGFPMSDATSKFRVTFTQEGTYKVTTSIKTLGENSEVLCSTENTVTASYVKSTLTTDMAGKTYEAGRTTEFSFTTTANSDVNTMVKGSFSIAQGSNAVNIADVAKLEYLDVNDSTWKEFYGDFGPATGFPMANATSNFRVTFKKAGNYAVTASMKTLDGTQLSAASANINVTYPTAAFTINGAAVEDKWYAAAQTITVSVSNVASEDCLATVKKNGNDDESAWTNDGSNNWSKNITLNTTGTVSCGSESVKVNIDPVVPSIADSDISYNRKENTKYLYIEYSVGDSGLAQVTVGDKTYTEWETTDKGIQFAVDWNVNQNTQIAIINGAGVSSASTAVKDAGEMSASFTHTGTNLTGNEVYMDAEDTITVTINNIPTDNRHYGFDKNRTVVTATVNGAEQTVAAGDAWTVNGTNATAQLKLNANDVYENLKVIVYKNYTWWPELEAATSEMFIYDAEAPVLNVTANVDAAATYHAGVATYTFTVYDLHMTKGVGSSALNLEYVLEVNGVNQTPVVVPMESWTTNDGKNYSTTIEVNNAKLVSYTVTGSDNVGNALAAGETMTNTVAGNNGYVYNGPKLICDTIAPTATVTFSDNVTAIFGRGGNVYLWLDESVTNENLEDAEPVDVTVTVTFEDRNLSLAHFGSNIDDDTGSWSGNPEENKDASVKYTKTITINPDETGVLALDITLADMLENAVQTIKVSAVNDTSYPFDIPVTNGQFALSFNIDRRRPTSTEGTDGAVDTALPVISVTNNEAPAYTTTDGLEIFKEAPSFTFSVNDGTAASGNSGLASVTWVLKDENEFVTGASKTKPYAANEEAVYSDTFNIATTLNESIESKESNQVTLRITVVDAAGNAITHVKYFGVDTQGPQITVVYDNNTAVNKEYFQAPRVATVTSSDINYNGMTINGTKYEELTREITYNEEGEHTLTISAADLVDNAANINWAGAKENPNVAVDHFYIDLHNPEISVQVTGAKTPVNTDDKANYHNGEITYEFTVTDMFIVEGGVTAVVTYEDDTTKNVELTLATGANEIDMDTYTGSITLTDGQVIKEITVNALDKSGRTSHWSHTENETEKMIVIDTTAPVITVTKTVAEGKKFVQTYNGTDYYNGGITYNVLVKDQFLTANVGTAQLIVTYADGTDTVVSMAENIMLIDETDSAAPALGGMDTYEISVPAADGATVTGITVQVIDNAGNVINGEKNNLVVKDKDNDESKTLTAFEYDETAKLWNYTGNPIVVDTVAPTAAMKFSDNVKSLYINGSTVYVILNNPTVADSGVASAQLAESVTVTINVNDLNLAIDNGNDNGVHAYTENYGWSGETPVNTESQITYTASSVSVTPDGTAVFAIDVKVSDLAGNVLTNFTSDKTSDKVHFLPVTVDAKGAFKYTVSLDRLRPTSGKEDTTAPTIVIEPTITPTKTASGLDLFNGAFQFKMNVNDGVASEKNSGLKYVEWIITDSNGVVAADKVTNSYETEDTQVFNADYAIQVALAKAIGESNMVTLDIIAEDNVGNQIALRKEFGVDTEAPRVKITQGNQSVKNDFYFNNDQTITIEITELNFDPTETSVTTEIPFGGWQNMGGNVYRGTLTYSTDGDYTFAMATTDLANNEATIDYITGLVALQKFTIDKTAPVIHVNFNPFVPVDTDGNLVQYFDDVRTVTVTIDEHNFRAADVVANLGAANALGIWSSNGDTHTASEMFTEGNGYSVTVNYTDLAGNPAVGYTSPTFSVDMQAPVIELSKGNMSTGTLNIVPDDLLLGFTITDHQDNLKDFTVDVLFLDNTYHQTKVEGVEYYTVTDGDRTNGYIDFTNIASVKANDGIYTVRVTALDYAGHQVNFPDVVFSLNRFGSTFTVNDGYTSSFLTADGTGIIYQNEVTSDLVITEINPNRVWQDAKKTVEGSVITVAANGNSVTLVPGEDYEVTVTEMGTGNNKWYEYTYAINPNVFNRNNELLDGEYTIFFYSEDEAGNKNTNESNEGSALLLGSDGNYSGKVSFTLDHKAPVVTVLNIEEGGQYVEVNKNVQINVSDNTPVSIAVYINDVLVEYVESADGQPLTSDWLTYDAQSGNYVLNMSEKDEVQNVRILVTDAAGNVFEQTIGDITLTENLWIQFINNEILVISSIVGLIGLIILIILLLKKRNKKEEETAAV